MYDGNVLGDFWIDPNEGDVKDAILVYCDIQKRMTCIKPVPVKSEIINIISDEQEIWLGEHDPGFKVQSVQVIQPLMVKRSL